MKTSITIGAPDSGKKGSFEEVATYAVEAEKLGVDQVWSGEAWGMDAVAPLAFVAARTTRMEIGTSILQVSARAPVMTAMTAMTMDAITGGRFILGLGVSGPQVVEGLHGMPFAHPLGRLRECIEIIRIAFSGEKIQYKGKHYELPLPGGEGKALRMAQPPNPDIPIYIAALGPKSLELTGELAQGWRGTSFTPEGADAPLSHIRKGAEKAGRDFSEIAIAAGGPVGFGDVDELIALRKPAIAFQLGGMGSATTNFYNNAYREIGFEDVAIEIQRLWAEHKRDRATALVPDEMVLHTSLLGTEDMVRERIRKYRDAGVTQLGSVAPMGKTASERLDTLGRFVELVREECGGAG